MMRAVLTLLVTLLLGCPKTVAPTERPQVDVSPWAQRSITSESTGVQYAYLHLPGPSPDAPVMLLLPGGIYDHRMWLYTADLAQHFELLALDWPADSPLYEGRVESLGASAADFLGSLGIDRLHLAGISGGGFAAVDLASRFPDIRVESLTLISTATFSITREEVRKRGRMGRVALRLPRGLLVRIIERQALAALEDTAPGPVEQRDLLWIRPESYYDQIFGMAATQGDRRQDTAAITCPVLVLHGTEDQTMPLRIARLTPTVYPDATMVELEGYGHTMAFSHGPEIAAEMLAFLGARSLLAPTRVADAP